MIKVSDLVVSFLEKKGVKHVFMLPGGGAMHLNDSVGRSKVIDYVPVLHEQAAAIAAETYSKFGKAKGVAVLTTGPAGTNAVTGVAGAWSDSIPCFFVSGQVKREDMIGNKGLRISGYQEADIIKIVKPITKYAETVLDPNKVIYHLEKAWYMMEEGRPGPVWVDVPLDVQAAVVDKRKLVHFKAPKRDGMSGVELKSVARRIIGLLASAKRPVLLAGNGIRLSGGMSEFYRMIKKLNIPILTTWGAVDFVDENHPLFFGRPNMLGGNRAANFILQNSDVLLAVGARLGVQQIGYNHKAFARESKLIMVDIDKRELDKKTLHPYIRVRCDAKMFMSALNSQLKKQRSVSPIKDWIGYCGRVKKKYPVVLPEYYREKRYVNSYVFVDILSEELSGKDVISPSSSGSSYVCTCQAFKTKMGQRFFTSRGMAAMGWDIPSSIGACLASGKRRTICVTGDGSIQMNIQELQTIIARRLPVKIFVLNNGGYLTIKNTQKAYFKGHLVGCNRQSGLVLPDLRKVASSYGFPTEIIRNNKEIRGKVRKVLRHKGPFFCEIMMSPDQLAIPRLASMRNKAGKMVSRPLEDLFPLLDREEFESNMFIKPYE
ncbi:thiamine pyrophosphate-binding protein [Candidatus Woesearchaeota archaeon]|nr:thiamine pyrophosphate-binding protein [Candidatus Woesearchaeota archaeon]